MTRAQLKHVLLDVDFKDKPKIIDLEIEFKPIARLLLLDILAACSKATNAEISRNVCQFLGNRIGIDAESVEKILDYCIKNEILWSVNGKITNSRVIKDQESYFKKLETDRLRKDPRRIPTGKETEKEKILNGSNKDPDIDIDIESIKENSQPPKLPPILDTPEMRDAFLACNERLKKSGRPLDEIALNQLFARFSCDKSRLLKAFQFTASLTKAKNVIEPPDKTQAQYQKQDPPRARIPEFKPPEREKVDPNSPEVLAAKAKIKALTGVSV